ncbi:MAG: efflux transporter outer membrane subunit [Nevskiaceae bacterium]|nr:MAG: efflux transporter outer membrane subunit [Nevskiaceae bacterium]
MNARLALSLPLVLALAGCVLAPRLAPPAQPVDDKTLGLHGDATAPATDGWWQVYGDPQLDRLITDSLRDNPRLAEALSRVRGAQAQVQAASAGNQPGFSLDGQEIYQRFPERDIVPPPFGGGHYWRGQLGLNLNWDLDFFGRQAAIIEQSRAGTRAAALDAEAARLALAGAIAQAYVDLDRAWAYADIASRTQAQREAILALTQQRLRAGLDTRSELRAAESALPQARLAKLQAEASVDLAVHRLAALSGRGAEAYAGIARPRLNLAAALPLPQTLPINLLARRPDVLAARARVDAATQGQAAAKAAFYPDINLTAFAGFAAIGLDNLFNSADRSYGIGPAIHLPLFDAQRLKAAYRGAAAEADAAVAAYNETVLEAVRQTADQLTLIQATQRQLDESRQSLAASEDAWRLAELRYRKGLSGYLNVLNAETAVLAARRTQVDLLAAQAVARVSLLLALGGSFDPDRLNALQGASS